MYTHLFLPSKVFTLKHFHGFLGVICLLMRWRWLSLTAGSHQERKIHMSITWTDHSTSLYLIPTHCSNINIFILDFFFFFFYPKQTKIFSWQEETFHSPSRPEHSGVSHARKGWRTSFAISAFEKKQNKRTWWILIGWKKNTWTFLAWGLKAYCYSH